MVLETGIVSVSVALMQAEEYGTSWTGEVGRTFADCPFHSGLEGADSLPAREAETALEEEESIDSMAPGFRAKIEGAADKIAGLERVSPPSSGRSKW